MTSNATPNSVTLSWDISSTDEETSDISGYIIEYRATDDSTDFKQMATLDADATEYTASTLSDDTEYEFVVKSQNKAGCCNESVSATIRTPHKVGMCIYNCYITFGSNDIHFKQYIWLVSKHACVSVNVAP